MKDNLSIIILYVIILMPVILTIFSYIWNKIESFVKRRKENDNRKTIRKNANKRRN